MLEPNLINKRMYEKKLHLMSPLLSSLFIAKMFGVFKVTIILPFSFPFAVKSVTTVIIVFDIKPGMMS